MLSRMDIHDEEAVRDLADAYSTQHEAGLTIRPNAIHILVELKKRGIRRALVTNGTGEGQRKKLMRFGLLEHLDAIFIEGEMGVGKPDVRAYAYVVKELGVKASDCWMVGDNLSWDIWGPQQLGIYSVWRDRKNEGLQQNTIATPDAVIGDIGELLELLD